MKGSPVPVTGQTVFVACADILGFKNLVETQSLTTIVQTFASFLGDGKTAAGHLDFATGKAFLPGQFVDEGTRLGAAVDYTVFSDTVFLWTRDASPTALRAVLDATIMIVAGGLASPHLLLPFRAGIAKGDVYLDPEAGIYVGPAIVEAYRAEQMQDWLGAVVGDSVTDTELEAALKGTIQQRVVAHDVPVHSDRVRDGSTKTHRRLRAVNWSMGIGPEPHVQMLLGQLEADAGKAHTRKFKEASAFYHQHRTR